MSLVMIAALILSVISFVSAAQSSLIHYVPEECEPDRLIERLESYLEWDEPIAFRITLEHECRPYVDYSNTPQLYKVMDKVLNSQLSLSSRSMMLSSFMRFGCNKAFNRTFYKSTTLQPLSILKMLKSYRCKPNTFYLNSIARRYPADSSERAFLLYWMFSDERQSLPQWPFRPSSSSTSIMSVKRPRIDYKLRLSQSFENPFLRRRFRNFINIYRNSPSTSTHTSINIINEDETYSSPLLLTFEENVGLDLDDLNASPPKSRSPLKAPSPIRPTPTEPVTETSSIVTTTSVRSASKELDLNFGHLMGAASMDIEPTMIVKNGKKPFRMQSNLALLDNNFLMLSNDQHRFKDILKKLEKLKTLDVSSVSSVAQKIKSRNANFGFVRIPKGTNQLQALLYKDIRLIVLSHCESEDYYSYKYPADPYEDLKKSSEDLESVSLSIEENDVVLLVNRNSFLPRTLDRAPGEDPSEPAEVAPGLRPHDLAGIFYFADLVNFDHLFRLLLKHTHSRTKLHGLLLVGGFIFNSHSDNSNKPTNCK